MKSIHLICDMQYGSCGKGLFAGYLAKTVQPDAVAIAWGPNAGHTFIDDDGTKMVNIALPNGIVSPKLRRIFIGPGSVINPELLQSEIERYAEWLERVDIVIHEHAAVVHERHREREAGYGFAIGSTMKGVGEAQIEKIRRGIDGHGVAATALRGTPLESRVCDVGTYNELMDGVETLQVEGSQGYSLSINHGFYPYVTSRDCTTMQILSDCGIPMGRHTWRQHMTVYGVCRTYPIRVANRYDDSGRQIGYSGPCYPDQQEISWADIGVPPELTTVTKLPRRVFSFSMQQVEDAARQNGVDAIFLNFVNYWPKGHDDRGQIEDIEKCTRAKVKWLGHGPRLQDVHAL